MNVFDQFDAPQQQAQSQSGNAFDKFDAPASAPSVSAKPQETNEGLGFYQGAVNALDNAASGAKWLANSGAVPGLAPGSGDEIDKAAQMLGFESAEHARAAHQAYVQQQENAGEKPGEVGKIAGETVAGLPLMALPGGGLTMGALSGALNTDKSTPLGVAEDTATGAALGKAGEYGVKALANVASPALSKAVQRLMDAGVDLTPGQIVGGFGKRLEDAATSVPFLGDAIIKARNAGLESFNRAVTNHVLSPIGEKLPDDIPVGREAVSYAGQKISDAYNNLLSKLTVNFDPTFGANVASLKGLAQNLPAQQRTQFNAVLKMALSKFSPVGVMTGQTMKDLDTTLGAMVRRYKGRTAAPADQDYGDAVHELQSQLRDLVERSNPAHQGKLQAVNQAYAGQLRLENAAARTGNENGVFTAPQLHAAVRAMDYSARKRAFARGNAMLQDISDAGKEVLPSKVPDSGTARRTMTGVGLGGAAHLLAPSLDPTLVGSTAGAWLAYSKPGRAVMRAMLANRPQGAQAVAGAIRKAAKPAAIASAAALTGGASPAIAQPQNQAAQP